jgi:hypothetical protein
LADACWADKVEIESDKVIAIITDDRTDVPLKRPHVRSHPHRSAAAQAEVRPPAKARPIRSSFDANTCILHPAVRSSA